MAATKCPICNIVVTTKRTKGDFSTYECPNCGKYKMSTSVLGEFKKLRPKAKTILSHRIWQRQKPRIIFRVEVTEISALKCNKDRIPTPAEQLDLFILYMGDLLKEAPGTARIMDSNLLRAKLCAITKEDVDFVDYSATEKGLLLGTGTRDTSGGKLTIKGWKYYEQLIRGAVHSKTAFMAMPFRYEDVTQMVDTVFRPAVEETGFKLKRVDEEPRAGSIDDRIRVDIRLSRFLIADLTCGNQGAYWEAGYAEGLGKPVIYTCNKHYFESQGTHFDTNHHQTVVWDPADPTRAAEDLKATIRATLPFEAVMPKE